MRRWGVAGPPVCLQETSEDRGEPRAPVNTGKLATKSGNNGPKPLVHILGCVNETRVKIEGGDDSPSGHWITNLCPL